MMQMIWHFRGTNLGITAAPILVSPVRREEDENFSLDRIGET